MESITDDRCLVESVLQEQARVPYAYGDIKLMTVFDREDNHYLLMQAGYNGERRVHGCLAHIDILDGKIWIQKDGTPHGLANDFMEAGVPADRIVLAFHTPLERTFDDFAVA